MKTRISSLGVLLLAGFIAGCQTQAENGAVIGGGVGVAAGAIITHSPGGAVVGGAIGAVTGAAIGAVLDQKDRNKLEKSSPQTVEKIDQGAQLNVADIIAMSNAGLSDEVIIQQIDSTHSVFYISQGLEVSLQDAGVSQNVINAMMSTELENNVPDDETG